MAASFAALASATSVVSGSRSVCHSLAAPETSSATAARSNARLGAGLSLPSSLQRRSCFETSPRPVLQRKDQLCRSTKASRVVAFYGLTSPPYKLDALEPYMSQKALEIHWEKHHGDYVVCLNKQLANSRLYGLTLDELVKVAYNNGNPFPEFNNAAQLWNHNFFWESMQPDGGSMPTAGLLQQIEKDFGSFPNFKEEFVTAAMTLFGSGWVWLVLKPREKRLAVVRTSNAVNPLALGDIPIINLDMWEHAYYLDYKNDRGKYVNAFMNHLVSWHSVTARMARAEAFVNLGEPKIPVA